MKPKLLHLEQLVYRAMNKRPLLLTLSLLFLIGVLVYWDQLTFKSVYMLCSDAYDQFLPEMSNLSALLYKGQFPMWSFAKGLGQQVTTSNANWLGDIFAWISIGAGPGWMPYTFGWIMLLKVVLSGLFFYLFLQELETAPFVKILFSILYAFCGHMLVRGIWMHYATEVVFVAFALYALELYCRKNNRIVYPVAFAILLISRNVSYLYIYSLLSFIYIFLRSLFDGCSFKKTARNILKFIPIYLLGLGLSCIFILPGMVALLHSERAQNFGHIFTLNLASSAEMITAFARSFSYSITGGFSTILDNILEDPIPYCGIATMLLLPISLSISKAKKREWLVLLLLFGSVVLYYVFPLFSSFMNAFSSTAYKTSSFWTTICLLLIGVYGMQKSQAPSYQSNRHSIWIGSLLYLLAFILLLHSGTKLLLHETITVGILLILFTLLLFKVFSTRTRYPSIFRAICIVLVGIEMIAGSRNVLQSNQYYTAEDIARVANNDIAKVIQRVKQQDPSFYRVNASSAPYNAAQAQQYYGTTVYASLISDSQASFCDLFNIERPNSNLITNFYTREILSDLLSVKYFLRNDLSRDVPQNYRYLHTENGIEVYENTNYLPLGFVYDHVISTDKVGRLLGEQKEDIALDAAIISKRDAEIALQKGVSGFVVPNPRLIEQPCTYTVFSLNNMNPILNAPPEIIRYESINNDPAMELALNESPEKAICIVRMIIDSPALTDGQIYYRCAKEAFDETDSLHFVIAKGKHDYNLSYKCGEHLKALRVDVGDFNGTYRIENLRVSFLPLLTNKQASIAADELRERSLQLSSFSENQITGKLALDKPGYLFLSIPYDKGWAMKVDGVKTELQKANGGLSGAILQAGTHDIRLTYQTPLLREGAIITGLSFVILLFLIISRNKKTG